MKARLVIEYTHALVALEECRLHPGSASEKLLEARARILERPLPEGDDAMNLELRDARAVVVALIENELSTAAPNPMAIDRVSSRVTELAREATGG